MADINQFVFFDFEMLCSNRGMAFSDMEAIRLGAVKYNIETETVDFFDHFIRPIHLQPLSVFCKKLTGIKDSELQDANNFKTVFTDFLRWVGGIKRTQFFSWSASDITRLKLDAEKHHISPSTIKKIEKRYVDFQAIFTKRVTKNNFSVENALALYDLEFIGETHNPMYDAYNTLRIYLAFATEPVKSDILMVQHFIKNDINVNDTKLLNQTLKKHLKEDLAEFWTDLTIITKLKDAKKLIKRTFRLVNKYENILLNRSDLFDAEIQHNVRLIVGFYHELLKTYEDHLNYDSKTMILHEQLYMPIKQLSVS